MKTTWKITVTDTVIYNIKAESAEDAEELAMKWFEQREPNVKIEETEDEAEYEINK